MKKKTVYMNTLSWIEAIVSNWGEGGGVSGPSRAAHLAEQTGRKTIDIYNKMTIK